MTTSIPNWRDVMGFNAALEIVFFTVLTFLFFLLMLVGFVAATQDGWGVMLLIFAFFGVLISGAKLLTLFY